MDGLYGKCQTTMKDMKISLHISFRNIFFEFEVFIVCKTDFFIFFQRFLMELAFKILNICTLEFRLADS